MRLKVVLIIGIKTLRSLAIRSNVVCVTFKSRLRVGFLKRLHESCPAEVLFRNLCEVADLCEQ